MSFDLYLVNIIYTSTIFKLFFINLSIYVLIKLFFFFQKSIFTTAHVLHIYPTRKQPPQSEYIEKCELCSLIIHDYINVRANTHIKSMNLKNLTFMVSFQPCKEKYVFVHTFFYK